jgi:hypothetical protein
MNLKDARRKFGWKMVRINHYIISDISIHNNQIVIVIADSIDIVRRKIIKILPLTRPGNLI